ncbi:conserved hypothetical protein [Perkinsus marinus ATCC 50983]|uniref:EF-hand domain-containing protein n=1 Tax=Perkinsus marinus (strain ATCC 50983 / TXsc) TaxID=423536 RepID=C5LQP3_PERM5|nr:conserved hypothetical protein [Perkinsus marinus ATCC 50983]EER00778.1 conserved hypothetical protein [Perkinsus marinus ATCC 50983]|eukprot:XP_002768060.1 conserved hypothetical protein [Perkinsus marinus ATCC 50983]
MSDSRSEECLVDFLGKKRWNFARTRDDGPSSEDGAAEEKRASRRLQRLQGLTLPIKSSARHMVYAHLEEPSLHWITLNVYRLYNILIVISVITSVLVTLPVPDTLAYDTRDGLEVAETVFNVIFLLEIVVPAMRMLKLTRYSTGWRLLVISLSLSMDALRVPMLMLIFLVTWFASIIYWVEDVTLPDTARPAAAFASLPHAMWFSIVTISTVGYGDTAPATDGGRAISALLIIVGASYMALPLNIVGSTFWDVWTDRDKLLIIDKIQQRLSRRRITRDRLYEVFATMDEDGSGVIDITEFEHMLNRHFRLGMPTHSILRLFRTIDADGEGKISFDEFCSCLFPELVNPEMSFPTRASISRNHRASYASSGRASVMRVVPDDDFDPLEAEIEASKAGAARVGPSEGQYLRELEDTKAAETAHYAAVLARLSRFERELESTRRDMRRIAEVVEGIAESLRGRDHRGGAVHTDDPVNVEDVIFQQRV